MKKIIVFILLSFSFRVAHSQELLCQISLNYQTINTPNQQIFTSMYKDLSEFMNQTHWTNYIFSFNERIACNVILNITAFNGVDQFTATLQVSSSRPVYGTSLTTQVLNIMESQPFNFQYIENHPLEFNENTFSDELSSTLAYYAYIILGMDFDTFSELGGTEFYQKAQKIVTNATSGTSNKSVWTTMGTNRENNRYYLANFLANDAYRDYREALYKYNRLGLDVMSKDIVSGRASITEAIDLIRKIYQKKPNNILISIFLETKRNEIVNIYSEAPVQEVSRIKQTMQFIDPLHSSDYDNMGNNRQ